MLPLVCGCSLSTPLLAPSVSWLVVQVPPLPRIASQTSHGVPDAAHSTQVTTEPSGLTAGSRFGTFGFPSCVTVPVAKSSTMITGVAGLAV